MSYALVIVESPAKAETIAGYLGDDYKVESSIGHIRDLPSRDDPVPAAYKGEPWAKIGIDVDNDFKPLYVVSSRKKDQISKLKRLLAGADELFLATDEDREGEAIAWHLLEVLNPKVPVRRMVFHEITKGAITRALQETRDIDRRLVDAQEARRILDRLYGYEISPVLWRKITTGLSAGRVQSVATRIVVERERERMDFVAAGYWDLDLTLTAGDGTDFEASLVEVDGQRVAAGRDFGDDGQLANEVVVLDEATATELANDLSGGTVEVVSVESKPYRRRPAAPFITSTFQQEAGRRLRLSSSLAMHAAQGLYQKGYITYMRTDSTTLSDTAQRAARAEVVERFGRAFLPDAPRTYEKKVRSAQEAHEAIRPAGDRFRHPDEVAGELPSIEARVYEMIWQRTVASQMTDAVGETVQLQFSCAAGARRVLLGASGTMIMHQGFRRVYVETTEEARDPASTNDNRESVLPELATGDAVAVADAAPQGHTTQPPPRFTEASLVKRLEEIGVGRPSTYASTMETIQNRDYVWRKGSALVPTLSAFAVTTLLERHFPRLIDYDFTATMEAALDEIANGTAEAVPWLSAFYFGSNGDIGLKAKVTTRLGDIDPKGVSTVPLGTTAAGEPVIACYGKFGAYVEVGERTASIPDDIAPDELTVERAVEFLDTPTEQVLGDDPETGLPVIAKAGKFGPYVSLGRFPKWPSPSSPGGRLLALPLHRKELRVALAYAGSIVPEPDDEAVRRAIVIPKRGVGKGAFERLDAFATKHGISLATAFERAEEAGVTSAAVKGIRSFLELRSTMRGRTGEGAATVLRATLEASGYLAELRSADEEDRLGNLESLFTVLDEFASIDEMVEELDRIADLESQPKPRTASLFQTMTLERITFEDAMQLLSLPRTVGVDPADGVEVTVQNGRFGPYLTKGSDSRSLDNEEQLLTITLDECLTILAQPKKYGRARTKPPLRELGTDPHSDRTILLKDGQYGPYVTDGETNASLRRGDSVEEISDERAAELLAERRAKGPAKKKPRRRKS
ncbi:MAG: type I DNA topoisomerase [Acidimicrobiales bacterium]|jgi:DNA topoisomerase-1|nr:type I DNA topoisomerase [Acidimicrobiales bacterium]MDP7507618.1 type I DNA topoisomerase [Acidimicrobiales bacterium]|tara:strand:+ start:2271 stop:5354 length:3084 start_codon:yes stop_codon:yes gene_type:complete